MSRTLAQDLNAVNAIHVSLMPSDILIRLFSNLYPPPIYGDPPPLNIFGAISDKHVFSSISYTWGSWLITHHSPFLTGRSCCWLVQPHTVPFWGRGSTSNVCITLSNLLKILFSFFFSPIEFGNLSSVNLDVDKGSLDCQCLLKSGLARYFLSATKRNWSCFTGSCWFHNWY